MFRSAKDIHENGSWQEMTPGAEIYEPATSRLVMTGEWRVETPDWESAKCKQCLLCAPYCPDASIRIVDGKMSGMDLNYCKGCGICAKVCPFGAITMKRKGEE
ncbi:MAG: 4Fe-4S binding protein [Eubacterium sp.]|nr:4Fe-4S binding protein [Eubacterium sp.]